jgi:hypothetical protein
MNRKAFLVGYLYKDATAVTKTVDAATALKAALGLGTAGGAGIGYGVGHLLSPTQTDINNEVRKLELAEAKELRDILEEHKKRREAEVPSANKTLYI